MVITLLVEKMRQKLQRWKANWRREEMKLGFDNIRLDQRSFVCFILSTMISCWTNNPEWFAINYPTCYRTGQGPSYWNFVERVGKLLPTSSAFECTTVCRNVCVSRASWWHNCMCRAMDGWMDADDDDRPAREEELAEPEIPEIVIRIMISWFFWQPPYRWLGALFQFKGAPTQRRSVH